MEDADGRSEEPLPVRALAKDDFSKGFMDLLKQLTSVGEVSSHEFSQRFEEIMHTQSSPYSIAVVEAEGRIVAAGTLLIEKKFVHHCGSVGHIEDVVVDARMRGHHLGHHIVEYLTGCAQQAGCYKESIFAFESNLRALDGLIGPFFLLSVSLGRSALSLILGTVSFNLIWYME